MEPSIRLLLAQMDFTVGAPADNAARIARVLTEARGHLRADVVAFPELALCGYTPEDLLLRPGFLGACDDALATLPAASGGTVALVGHPARGLAGVSAPDLDNPPLANAVAVLRDGALETRYAKQALPDYGVFDERRWFSPGSRACVIDVRGVATGVLICEDLWADEPVARTVAAGAEWLVVVNASPFELGKHARRRERLTTLARRHGVAIAYLNLVGGQDEVVFDGDSMLVDADGHVAANAPSFADALLVCDYRPATRRFHAPDWPHRGEDETAIVWAGLVRGIRDYVAKNGFPGVLLGLSGGIDSALTLALAVEALGAARVTAVMLPSRHTSELSLELAREQAARLGVEYRTLTIEPGREALMATLAPVFGDADPGIAGENLQARLRGVLLMALSNFSGRLLLTTGNKSEMAVGYATLYGDMDGGYAPLKDVYKTLVYRLARWRNTRAAATGEVEIIPAEVIERPPSAELRDDQTDQDSLPPYDELDAILKRLIEDSAARAAIVAEGFDAATVERVAKLVYRNEFKRRQAAPGPKITTRAFGRERRYPISSGWS